MSCCQIARYPYTAPTAGLPTAGLANLSAWGTHTHTHTHTAPVAHTGLPAATAAAATPGGIRWGATAAAAAGGAHDAAGVAGVAGGLPVLARPWFVTRLIAETTDLVLLNMVLSVVTGEFQVRSHPPTTTTTHHHRRHRRHRRRRHRRHRRRRHRHRRHRRRRRHRHHTHAQHRQTSLKQGATPCHHTQRSF